MAGTLVDVRLVRPWRRFRKGHILKKPVAVLRQWLVRQGFAEIVEPEIECAAIEPPERAVAPRQSAKPRKRKARK